MKNILLLLAFIAPTIIVTAQTNVTTLQNDWRWRKDDNDEVNATWKAPLNTSITAVAANNILRLRIALTVTTAGTNGNAALNDNLQYSTDISTNAVWTDIATTATNNDPFILNNTGNRVAYPTQTTQQLQAPNANTFIQGECVINSNKTQYTPNLGAANNQTEIEWFLTVTTNAAPGTTYYFRDHGTTCNCTPSNPPNYPSLTMSGVLPVKLTSFTVNNNVKSIKLDWSTAMEQKNARFDILRSNDSKTWKTIASVKGHGTTNLVSNYQVYDENPLNGINYYQLKQVDLDGNFYLSAIRAITLTQVVKSIINITPNPTHGSINFIATSKFSNVAAALSTMTGNVLYKELISVLNANSLTKLKIQKLPAPGVYILTLKAAGLSEAHKVIIN